MGIQVIRQPGDPDRFAVFSSTTDSWRAWDLSRQDVIEYLVEVAAQEARRQAEQLMANIEVSPTHAYYQFAMSFREANALSVEHGGPDLSSKEKNGA